MISAAINTSKNVSWLSFCSLESIIEFTLFSSTWTSSWLGQIMKSFLIYRNVNVGFSGIDLKAKFSKYSKYILAIAGDNDGSIAKPSIRQYIY